jgi:hypothetical protein
MIYFVSIVPNAPIKALEFMSCSNPRSEILMPYFCAVFVLMQSEKDLAGDSALSLCVCKVGTPRKGFLRVHRLFIAGMKLTCVHRFSLHNLFAVSDIQPKGVDRCYYPVMRADEDRAVDARLRGSGLFRRQADGTTRPKRPLGDGLCSNIEPTSTMPAVDWSVKRMPATFAKRLLGC